jgi:hypothetical protein
MGERAKKRFVFAILHYRFDESGARHEHRERHKALGIFGVIVPRSVVIVAEDVVSGRGYSRHSSGLTYKKEEQPRRKEARPASVFESWNDRDDRRRKRCL